MKFNGEHLKSHFEAKELGDWYVDETGYPDVVYSTKVKQLAGSEFPFSFAKSKRSLDFLAKGDCIFVKSKLSIKISR